MEEHWKLASNLQREDNYVPIIIKYTSRKSTCMALNLFVLLHNQKHKEGVSRRKKTTTRLECTLFVLRMSKPKFSHLNTAGIKESWGQGPP